METLSLLQINIGETARIQAFNGGKSLALKLRQYGLFVGDQVRIVRTAPFDGPILVESGGREIALGKGVASKILVDKN